MVGAGFFLLPEVSCIACGGIDSLGDGGVECKDDWDLVQMGLDQSFGFNLLCIFNAFTLFLT